MNKNITKGQKEILTCKYSHIKQILSALFLILVIIFLLASCSPDKASPSNSYYQTFQGKFISGIIINFGFTFEYPRAWQAGFAEQTSDLIYGGMTGPAVSDITLPNGKKEANLGMLLRIYLGLGEKAEEKARDEINGVIVSGKLYPDFMLLNQDSINLDGYNGYQVKVTYTHGTIPIGGLYTRKEFYIEIPRNGNVYEIEFAASENEWNAREKDIQHILDTFKWK